MPGRARRPRASCVTGRLVFGGSRFLRCCVVGALRRTRGPVRAGIGCVCAREEARLAVGNTGFRSVRTGRRRAGFACVAVDVPAVSPGSTRPVAVGEVRAGAIRTAPVLSGGAARAGAAVVLAGAVRTPSASVLDGGGTGASPDPVLPTAGVVSAEAASVRGAVGGAVRREVVAVGFAAGVVSAGIPGAGAGQGGRWFGAPGAGFAVEGGAFPGVPGEHVGHADAAVGVHRTAAASTGRGIGVLTGAGGVAVVRHSVSSRTSGAPVGAARLRTRPRVAGSPRTRRTGGAFRYRTDTRRW
ncbi:hypothetical protein BJY18_005072 [Amycolatopsis jiangsuensis]|uniref:Uncharacterized protein n=1 Tax=Amycolatopsis jiangsuensis TaxID=1181879 RepID=A0A840J279_9PSEU|nr:hypothetical protein [Amycolatopsis jiangsuensis]